jgi:hypothetical protein
VGGGAGEELWVYKGSGEGGGGGGSKRLMVGGPRGEPEAGRRSGRRRREEGVGGNRVLPLGDRPGDRGSNGEDYEPNIVAP